MLKRWIHRTEIILILPDSRFSCYYNYLFCLVKLRILLFIFKWNLPIEKCLVVYLRILSHYLIIVLSLLICFLKIILKCMWVLVPDIKTLHRFLLVLFIHVVMRSHTPILAFIFIGVFIEWWIRWLLFALLLFQRKHFHELFTELIFKHFVSIFIFHTLFVFFFISLVKINPKISESLNLKMELKFWFKSFIYFLLFNFMELKFKRQ